MRRLQNTLETCPQGRGGLSRQGLKSPVYKGGGGTAGMVTWERFLEEVGASWGNSLVRVRTART